MKSVERTSQTFSSKEVGLLGMAVLSDNPSYSGGRGRRIVSSMPGLAKLVRPCLNTTTTTNSNKSKTKRDWWYSTSGEHLPSIFGFNTQHNTKKQNKIKHT
jgi:hypothetical protein